ncbi:uncharacterized protein LOC109579258 isoform X2 [Bactrocera dorsalis]|uniref:Uncharacterized protein LOC109579258 isoform X2 n=1 Tax=Bactrocera dorsalis TaxID=27457 RepID=A0ABM3KA30_BACDO|nr:uncharacterized protein LOC109579258 isoform X2 [Bactrocera dorsalis]
MTIKDYSKHRYEISKSVERIFNNVFVIREGLVLSSSKKKNRLSNIKIKSSFADEFLNPFYTKINESSSKFELNDIRRHNKKQCDCYTQKYTSKYQDFKFSSGVFHSVRSSGIKTLNKRNLGRYSVISQINFTQNENVNISHHCILDDIQKIRRYCFKNEKHECPTSNGSEIGNISTYKLIKTSLYSNRMKSYSKYPNKYQKKNYIYPPLEQSKHVFKNIIFGPRNYGTVQGSMFFDSNLTNKSRKYKYGAEKLFQLSFVDICKSCSSSLLSSERGYSKNECNPLIEKFSLLQNNSTRTKNVTNGVLENYDNKLYNCSLERYSEIYNRPISIITSLNMHKVPGSEIMNSKQQEKSDSLSLACKVAKVQKQIDFDDLVIFTSYTLSLKSGMHSPDIGKLYYDSKSVSNLFLFASNSILRVSENNITYLEKINQISTHVKDISKNVVLDERLKFKQMLSTNVNSTKNRDISDNKIISSETKITNFLFQENDLFRMKYNYCIKFSILLENMDLILFSIDNPYFLLESVKVNERDAFDNPHHKYDSLLNPCLDSEKFVYNLKFNKPNIITKPQTQNFVETRSVQILDIQDHNNLNFLSNVTSATKYRNNAQHEPTFDADMTNTSEDKVILTNYSLIRNDKNVKLIRENRFSTNDSEVSRTHMISNQKIKLNAISVLNLLNDVKCIPYNNFTVNASENDRVFQEKMFKENMYAPVVSSTGKYDGVLYSDCKPNISVINIVSKCENNNKLGYFQQKYNSWSNLYTCDCKDFVLFSYHSSNINISKILVDSIYYVNLNDLLRRNTSAVCMNNIVDYRIRTPLFKDVISDQFKFLKLWKTKYIAGSVPNCRDIGNIIYKSKTKLTFEGNNILYNIQSSEQQTLFKFNKTKNYICYAIRSNTALSDCTPTKQLHNEAISFKLNSSLNNGAMLKNFSTIHNSKAKYTAFFAYSLFGTRAFQWYRC